MDNDGRRWARHHAASDSAGDADHHMAVTSNPKEDPEGIKGARHGHHLVRIVEISDGTATLPWPMRSAWRQRRPPWNLGHGVPASMVNGGQDKNIALIMKRPDETEGCTPLYPGIARDLRIPSLP